MTHQDHLELQVWELMVAEDVVEEVDLDAKLEEGVVVEDMANKGGHQTMQA